MKIERTAHLSHECPYCETKCQFTSLLLYEVRYEGEGEAPFTSDWDFPNDIPCCKEGDGSSREILYHEPYRCYLCHGVIVIKWNQERVEAADRDISGSTESFCFYYHSSIPLVGGYKKMVNLEYVTSTPEVKEDFLEAISCYNHGLYNASMVMSRRAIEQEAFDKGAKGNDLHKKIEALDINKELKALLKEIKDLGNFGAHPALRGKTIKDEKKCAELSLRFLDTYLTLQKQSA